MMFRLENNVPDYYVENSRDFQLLCRLYDLALQPTRYSINSLKHASDTKLCNDALLPFLGTKVGFFTTYDSTDDSLRKIISSFPYIVKYKGSIVALRYIANMFSRLTNAEVIVDETAISEHRILLLFKTPYKNIDLFYELVEYVRPAGFIIEYDVEEVIDVNKNPDRVSNKDIVEISKSENSEKYAIVGDSDPFNSLESGIGFTQVVSKEQVSET